MRPETRVHPKKKYELYHSAQKRPPLTHTYIHTYVHTYIHVCIQTYPHTDINYNQLN